MGKRHDMLRRCAQVRDLIQENKYVQALEVIDSLPLAEVDALEDLYLFADLYEKAERLDKKKDIFFLIYRRTGSRYILNRLLRLVIRMGEMEEARELFLAYEFAGNITLDTFELRYLLAKAEGEPRTTLINILEELKREEYTEEWGYQLARLYEQEGMREECIRECRDLKLWFGEGRIVDKAEELRRRCEMPGWQPPREEEIPEPEQPDLGEKFSYASSPVGLQDIDIERTLIVDDGLEGSVEPDVESREDVEEMEEGESIKESVPEHAVDTAPDTAANAVYDEPGTEDGTAPGEDGIPYEGDYVSDPVVVKRDQPEKSPRRRLVPDPGEVLEDEHEYISEHGITYRTLKSTIAHVRADREHAHFVYAGGEERIMLAVAKRITKELNHVGYLSARSIMKITADKLNQLELLEQVDKLSGGCLLVTHAPEMTEKTVGDLLSLMEENGDQIVVMLAGPFDEIDCFLSIYPELAGKLIYKIQM